MGEYGRDLLRLAYPSTPATRRLSLAGRLVSRDQPQPGEHKRKPKPFIRTAGPDRIIENVNHGYQVMVSDH
jgi:hypothetical protein